MLSQLFSSVCMTTHASSQLSLGCPGCGELFAHIFYKWAASCALLAFTLGLFSVTEHFWVCLWLKNKPSPAMTVLNENAFCSTQYALWFPITGLLISFTCPPCVPPGPQPIFLWTDSSPCSVLKATLGSRCCETLECLSTNPGDAEM